MKISSTSILIAFGFVLLIQACTPAGGEKRGKEFMPDMFHSIAYEANYYDYYYFNTWGTEEEYYKMAKPRTPVEGTIARGYTASYYAQDDAERAAAAKRIAGTDDNSSFKLPPNGAAPYYYEDTEADRARATAEIVQNPYPITEKGLAHGKELYDVYCGICHGEKADGNGYIVREDGGVYPAQPTSFLTDDLINATNGRYYHAIIYGLNMMGGYEDKLSYEERWQVIHHIRSLQAKSAGLAYDENANTLNAVDVPGATVSEVYEVSAVEEEAHSDEGEGHSGDGHGHGH